MNWTLIVKNDLDSIKGDQNLLNEKILENWKTKTLINFNVDYKHFRLKILRSIYKILEAMHFTSDFVSNLF